MNDWEKYIERSMEILNSRKQEGICFDDFRRAFDKGVVQFVSCPDGFDDVVCRIGDGWFYFAGMDGEGMAPSDFLYEVGIENALSMAYRYMVDDLREIDPDEVAYYEALIEECKE